MSACVVHIWQNVYIYVHRLMIWRKTMTSVKKGRYLVMMCVLCICKKLVRQYIIFLSWCVGRSKVAATGKCYKSFVTQLTTGCDTVTNQSGHKLSVKPSKKHKQGAAYSSKVFIISCVSASVSVSNSDDTNFHQPRLEELNYAPTWPSRQLLQSHTSVISHNAEHTSSI